MQSFVKEQILPECDSKWLREQISWRFQLIWGCKYFERRCQLQEWLYAVAAAPPLMAVLVDTKVSLLTSFDDGVRALDLGS